MCLTNVFVNWPGTTLVIGFTLLIGCTYFAFLMDYFKMDFQSQRDFLVWKDPTVKQWMMHDLAKDYLEKN